ncbi:uncharacterized protein LOC116302384 isoform X2 [Actinia tenebrosa]|nr:uncharacterized protein LOC116302384 isoform X2 [Actinia tenebrosa]
MLPTSRYTRSTHSCSVQSTDWLECILRCSEDNNCVSYHFDMVKGICGLNSFGLSASFSSCDSERLVYSEGVVFQQLRKEKNQVQCLSEKTCAPELNQAGGESCKAQVLRTSCKEIRDKGESHGDGEYTIKTPESTEILVYCDMTTDGGGWTLVKKTVLTSKTPNTLIVLSTNWRSISQYDDPKLVIQPAALKELRNRLGFNQMRWFCYKKSVNRKVHIMTKATASGESVIRYFSESPPVPAKACISFQLLPDDTSELARNCDGWGGPDNFDEWGRRDRSGETRVQYDVIRWQKNGISVNHFSMYPGQYLCDDGALSITSVNDTWAYYVR